MKTKLFILSIALLGSLASCGNASKGGGNELASWNECTALTSLKQFVSNAVNASSDKFIPVERRIAVFDMDGTLYGELFPTYLEYLMYVHRVKYDPQYTATPEQIALADEIEDLQDTHSYPSGTDMRHAYAAAEAYAGMTLKEFKDYCVTFCSQAADGFKGMTYGTAFYQPMKEVVEYLHVNDFQVYVVSGSDRFLCRNLLCDYLKIPENHIIGMDVKVKATGQGDTEGVNYTLKSDDQIVRTNELIIKNLKFNKVAQIIQEIGIQPVLSFGNSSGDSAMHVYTKTNNPYPAEAYMLVADDDVRDYGNLEKAAKCNKDWADAGFQIVSMKKDFKTIYGDKVERTGRIR